MIPDDATRARLLRLIAAGAVTLSEAATLIKVSRQLVRYWAINAGIEADIARRRYLRKLWKK